MYTCKSIQCPVPMFFRSTFCRKARMTMVSGHGHFVNLQSIGKSSFAQKRRCFSRESLAKVYLKKAFTRKLCGLNCGPVLSRFQEGRWEGSPYSSGADERGPTPRAKRKFKCSCHRMKCDTGRRLQVPCVGPVFFCHIYSHA